MRLRHTPRHRLGALAVAGALLVPLLAACGSSGDNSADVAARPSPTGPATRAPAWRTTSRCSSRSWTSSRQQTGIKVNLEVVGWSDLLNRHPRRDHLGQGPGRAQHRQHLVGLAAGHRRASCRSTTPTLQRRRRQGPLPRRQPRRRPARPASRRPRVPLYSLATRLYYNKKLFADAGISAPPTTWDELVADGKKLTKGEQWGLAVEGANLVGELAPRLHLRPAVRRRPGSTARASRQFDTAAERRGDQAVHRLHGRRQDRQPEQRRVRATTSRSPTSPTARPRCCCGRPPAVDSSRTA